MGNIAGTAINAVLTAIAAGVLLYYLRDRFEQLERSSDKRFDLVDRRFDLVDRRFEQVDADIRQLRDEVFQIAMQLGVKQRPRQV